LPRDVSEHVLVEQVHGGRVAGDRVL